jgi:hypothetical protein
MPNPAVPSPATWASGPVLAGALRADVANAVSFLSGPPLFLAYCLTSPSLTSGVSTEISLDTEAFDTWGGHNPPAVNYYCRAPGWYLINAFTDFSYAGATIHNFTCSIVSGLGGGAVTTLLNGEQAGGGSASQPPALSAVELIPLAQTAVTATDYVQLQARQDTGGAVTLTGGNYLSARWVGALSGTAGLPVPANPAWPSPPAYITSSFLNANIRDAIRFLTFRPMFRGYYAGTGQTIPSQTYPAGSVIHLDTITANAGTGGQAVDNYSGWSPSNSWWTAPVPGLYSCYGQVAMASTATSYQLNAGFSVNGTIQWAKGGYQGSGAALVPRSAIAMRKLRLNAGDTIALAGHQSTGSALGVSGSSKSACFSKMIILWESA